MIDITVFTLLILGSEIFVILFRHHAVNLMWTSYET